MHVNIHDTKHLSLCSTVQNQRIMNMVENQSVEMVMQYLQRGFKYRLTVQISCTVQYVGKLTKPVPFGRYYTEGIISKQKL